MKRHIGSTIAMVLGVLYFLSGITTPNEGLIAGPIMILGALAYRSAKKRKLTNNNSAIKIVFEICAIVIIILAISLQKNIGYLMTIHPVPNLLIPLWAIIAYLIIVLKRVNTSSEEKQSNKKVSNHD